MLGFSKELWGSAIKEETAAGAAIPIGKLGFKITPLPLPAAPKSASDVMREEIKQIRARAWRELQGQPAQKSLAKAIDPTGPGPVSQNHRRSDVGQFLASYAEGGTWG